MVYGAWNKWVLPIGQGRIERSDLLSPNRTRPEGVEWDHRGGYMGCGRRQRGKRVSASQ
jgi:hypothetical protein